MKMYFSFTLFVKSIPVNAEWVAGVSAVVLQIDIIRRRWRLAMVWSKSQLEQRRALPRIRPMSAFAPKSGP
jgi:hypothetical protein